LSGLRLAGHVFWNECGARVHGKPLFSALKLGAWGHIYLIVMKKNIIIIVLVVIAICSFVLWEKDSEHNATSLSLPSTCLDQPEGAPVITSLSNYSGSVGMELEINGCNFAGFEGDKNIWLENGLGIKGILFGESDSTNKLIKITLQSPLCQQDTSYSGLPCDDWLDVVSGKYKLYTMPWGNKSNLVDFIIK